MSGNDIPFIGTAPVPGNNVVLGRGVCLFDGFTTDTAQAFKRSVKKEFLAMLATPGGGSRVRKPSVPTIPHPQLTVKSLVQPGFGHVSSPCLNAPCVS